MRYSSSSKKAATVVKGTVPPLASTPPVVLSERSLLLLAVVRLFVSFLWFQQLAWKMPLGFGGLRRYVISEAQHTFVPGYSLLWRARREHVNPLVLLDAGVLFAAVGQIFGRIGNFINGDIIGYRSTLPWSTVYQNPSSWACTVNHATCNVPVQPTAGYELLTNLVVLVVLVLLARRVTRPGILMLVYLFCYVVTQFCLFFVRDNTIVSFLGLNWGLKQAQWTSLIVFLVLVPLTFFILRLRFAQPVPESERALTYGLSRKQASLPMEVIADRADSQGHERT